MIQRLWNAHVVPWMVETACAGSPVRRQREKIVPRARGRVLELGIGSGHNLAHYDPSQIASVVGIDPSTELLKRAHPRAERAPFAVTLEAASAEALPFDDASFDTVVVTYSLCSIPDDAGALGEVRRVLTPDGALLLSEHGLSPDAGPARWQHRLDPMWQRFGGGCHLNRDVARSLARAGFTTDGLASMYLPGPRWLNWHTWGEARPA